MTDGSQQVVPVTVEWARLGKEKQDAGFRVLECSNGVLDEKNFAALLTRYSPGTLESADLPQVTISWSKDSRQGHHYVGIARHYRQEDDEGDASGRWVMLTNYFCAPFKELSDGTVSYIGMHEKLAGVKLPLDPNGPINTELARSSVSGLVNDQQTWLAMRAAAALMTSDPVCVLGADHVSYVDRLRFIDKVAMLLPYGMRSELSASTWASPTYRTHKLRLFFANAERGKGDRLVPWGQQGDQRIGHGYADAYLDLLRSGSLTPEVLAGLTDPTGFDAREILQVVAHLRNLASQPRKRVAPASAAAVTTTAIERRSSAETAALPVDEQQTEFEQDNRAGENFDPIGVARVSQPAFVDLRRARPERADELGDIKEILASCAFALQQDDANLLGRGIEQLRGRAGGYPPHLRNQLKEIIVEDELLASTSFSDDELLAEFYKLLLHLAFPSPIKYQAYKNVEMVAGYEPGQRLHATLARALLGTSMEGAARLLLLNSLDGVQVAATEFTIAPHQSVSMLVEQVDQAHAKIISEMALRNLRATGKKSDHDRELFRESMARYRLLSVLQQKYAGQPDHLFSMLARILEYAYGDQLSLADVRHLLDNIPAAPSEALFGVMMSMANQRDLNSITREFLLRRVNYAGFSHDQLSTVQDLIMRKVAAAPSQRDEGHKHRAPFDRDKIIWIVIFALIFIALGVVIFLFVDLAQGY